MSLEEQIKVARGNQPADLLIQNARVVDVLSGDIVATDVAVHAGKVVGFGAYEADHVLDLEDRYLCPGFMDGHLHIESTMLIPPEFARTVVPHGTTAVMADPHEIGNVLGIEGINYMLRSSEGLPLTVYIMLPSCVPATDMETSGAELTSDDLALMLPRERVLGIAEMMNYPGVLAADPKVLNKIRIAGGRRVDGHAPGLSGRDLAAYIGAGIHSDHECTSADEAREKLRLGMYIMVRQGSTEKNLKELVRIITPENSRQFMLVSDDRNPADLLAEGHVDYLVRTAIAEGVPPMTAIQMATINTASYFGLAEAGAVAPGCQADFAVLDDLEKVDVSIVIKDGRVVAEEGRALPFDSGEPGRMVRSTINIDYKSLKHLDINAAGENIKVISVVPDQIVTEKLVVKPKVEDGLAVADVERDILKIAVVERHMASGNIGLGFVKGMGLREGAMATSVAHDSHNIIVVGTNDEDMRKAVLQIERMNGGACVVADGEVRAELSLPVAGLMSARPADEVADSAKAVITAARELGCHLDHPLAALSFLALPVVPALKLTDMGLVDVAGFQLVGLFD